MCANDQIEYTDPKDILHLPWDKDRKTQRFYLQHLERLLCLLFILPAAQFCIQRRGLFIS